MTENQDTPFGSPEGSRAQIEEVNQGFIEFSDALLWKGLATKPYDLTARIIFGRKGSGKTVYLRRAREFVINSNDYYTIEYVASQSVQTSEIIRFSRFYTKYDLRETWSLVWKRAIFRSLASHILIDDYFQSFNQSTAFINIRDNYNEIIQPVYRYRQSVSILNEVNAILQQYYSPKSYNKYLNNPLWGQFESDLLKIIKECKPICMYIDGMDDKYRNAPMYWLECQMGLFDAIMNLLRDSHFGGRLHVFAALRDTVLLKILKGDHALRNYYEYHTRTLDWNMKSIDYFFSEKIKRLENNHFTNHDEEKNVFNWLGVQSINENPLKVTEPITQYLLRHTRLLPRDIVALGNSLCHAIKTNKEWKKETPEKAIAKAAKECAHIIGNEVFDICASEISTDIEPQKGYHFDYEKFIGNDEYKKTIADQLKKLLLEINFERFDSSLLSVIDEKGRKTFGENIDILSILWINGLLGFAVDDIESGKVVFYCDEFGTEFKLPRNKKNYAFHPITSITVGLKPIDYLVIQHE